MTKRNHLLLIQLREQFLKAQARLQKAIETGRFMQWSLQKKQAIYQRLQRYAQRLGIMLKPAIVTALLTSGVVLCNTIKAQIVTEMTGPSNPLNGVTSTNYSKPAFADIDNDGDMDLVTGKFWATSLVFMNSGSAAAATFAGSSNFSCCYQIHYSAPAFIDIDSDGDLDVVFGNNYGVLQLYTNTGTAASPVFGTNPTGGTTPFSGIDIGNASTPTFVDIDNDGDKDLFIGASNGSVTYYKNTGTAASPVFTMQTGTDNPFNGVTIASGNSHPAFADIDNDGDMDAVFGGWGVGLSSGGVVGLIYYKNTGTVSSPVFTIQSGAANPFGNIVIPGNSSSGTFSAPTFTNIDGDSNLDLIVGRQDGGFSYFEISFSTLPVQWQSFTAKKRNNNVLLNWATAAEQNAQDFVIQHSINGQNWQQVGVVAAAGNSTVENNYQFVHQQPVTGNNYYRLLQRDKNGTISYSAVEIVQFAASNTAFTVTSSTVTNGQLLVAVSVPTTLRLFTSNGQLLQQFTVAQGNHTLVLNTYSKGIYFINGNGKTDRLIIQ